jgi:rhamnosyltransferase
MSSSEPRVLVLLAAYNGEQWIREQIESILRQKGVTVRVVVGDDGSTDRTAWVVKGMGRPERISLVSSVQPTGSAAQNFFLLIRGQAAETFDYVAFSDQDDLWSNDKLERACRALRSSGCAGYSSSVRAVWDDGRQTELRQCARCTSSDFIFEGAGQGCTFVLPADFYGEVRAFLISAESVTRPLRYHDWAIYALSRVWGRRWYFDPDSSMAYRQHGGNDTGAKQSLGGIIKRLSLIRNGWYREQILAITGLCRVANPVDAIASGWQALLTKPRGAQRTAQVALALLHGGRRKRSDNVTLICSALAGWI